MPPRVALVDSGVNRWHSHVRGAVRGCRILLDGEGRVVEDGDFSDPAGHGTAVAGVLRERLPEAELFAVRVFDGRLATYPSLVARGILRAAVEGCSVVNLSLSVDPGPGAGLVVQACEAALEAGCLLVASACAGSPDALPASLPGVVSVRADDRLAFGEIREEGPRRFAASGRPRDLAGLPRAANLWGPSFASARVAAHLARAAR